MKGFAVVFFAVLCTPAHADCTEETLPKIGMTLEQVMASCWQSPSRLQRSTTASHVEVRLSFTEGPSTGEVVLVDGKVTEIKETRNLNDPRNPLVRRK